MSYGPFKPVDDDLLSDFAKLVSHQFAQDKKQYPETATYEAAMRKVAANFPSLYERHIRRVAGDGGL